MIACNGYEQHFEGCSVKGEQKEYWMKLCERAANEQDPQKLMELVREITRLLEEKETRLKHDPKAAGESA